MRTQLMIMAIVGVIFVASVAIVVGFVWWLGWMGGLALSLGIFGLLAMSYFWIVKPWHMRWGATDEEAHISPIHGMLVRDINYDGNLDVICVANFYGADVRTGRYDASLGTCLIGNGRGDFDVLHSNESGLLNVGDARGLVSIVAEEGSIVVALNNRSGITSFKLNIGQHGSRYYPELAESRATLVFENGVSRKHEFYYGSGYLSQSSRALRVPPNAILQTTSDNE